MHLLRPEVDTSEAEFKKYGRNRIAEGKLPACAEQCATKALLAGDADVIADIYRQRVEIRGYGPELWGWKIAYGRKQRTEATKVRRENQDTGDAQNSPRRFPT